MLKFLDLIAYCGNPTQSAIHLLFSFVFYLQCITVVRARLCGEWIAVRPEELLSKLREANLETPARKDLMESVLSIGTGIARGRSVKFGRDTRRAIAVPRAYFTPHELKQIDNCK